MDDFISREAAIKAVCDCSAHTCKMGECFNSCNEAKALSSVPAADVVEVRHGHWYLDNGCAYCSECKNSFAPGIRSQALFCPRCGAKMDGDGE